MRPDSLEIIGGRIGAERKALGLTQSDLASRIGITMSRLANYEDGSGCLRCGIAFDICRNLVISEQWLATGKGRKNSYRDVAAHFPKKFFGKSFIDLYESHIATIYEEHPYAYDSFIPLLKYDDPDVWQIACFKILKDFSKPIADNRSLTEYWMKISEYAGNFGVYYAAHPRERLSDLCTKLSVLKNGQEEPFSYEMFFDDLSLIGLGWGDIENIAQGLLTVGETTKKIPIDIERLKEEVLDYLKERGKSTELKRYQKIHCKEQ